KIRPSPGDRNDGVRNRLFDLEGGACSESARDLVAVLVVETLIEIVEIRREARADGTADGRLDRDRSLWSVGTRDDLCADDVLVGQVFFRACDNRIESRLEATALVAREVRHVGACASARIDTVRLSGVRRGIGHEKNTPRTGYTRKNPLLCDRLALAVD